MATSFEFRVIRFEPDAQRGERVNIGLLVSDGKRLQVHLIKTWNKALALAPQVRFPVSLEADLVDMFSSIGENQPFADMPGIEPFTLSPARRFLLRRRRTARPD